MTAAAVDRTASRRTAFGQAAMANATPLPLPQTCAVRLIDRRTGQTLRLNGSPLVLFTRSPEDAAAELLAGRDSTLWEARIEPIGGQP
jgi:hypothetical protein